MNEFEQAAMQYESMTQKEKEAFVENVAQGLMFAEAEIQSVILEHFNCVDETLEKNLRKRLNF